MTASQFYHRLVDIIRPGSADALAWSSESDCAMSIVRLTDSKIVLWLPCMERTGGGWQASGVEGYILGQGDTGRWAELLRLMRTAGIPARVYKRPTGKPAQYYLYLLCRLSGEWVGFVTITVET